MAQARSLRCGVLMNEHAIAIGKEPVFALNGFAVGLEHDLAGRESAEHHEEGGAGEMKVGEDGVDSPEVERGIDVKAGAAGGGGEAAVGVDDGFEGADAGGADGDDAPAAFSGGVQGLGGFRGEFVALLIHGVILDGVAFHRTEGAGADMEGEFDDAAAAGADFLEHFRSKMKAGGGRGDGAGVFGVDGLIAFGIVLGEVIAVNVGGQGRFTDVLEGVEDGVGAGGADTVQSVGAVFENLEGEAAVKADMGADFRAAAAFHHHQPFAVGALHRFNKEAFHLTAGVFVTMGTGGNDAGVVEDQGIAGADEAGKVVHNAVGSGAAGAVQTEHAGLIPFLGGVLGDEAFRKIVIELGCFHGDHHNRKQDFR